MTGPAVEYTALLAAAEPFLRRYNPAQARDPHTGEWIGTGAWMHEVVDLAAGAVTLAAVDDDHVMVAFGDGKAHTRLSPRTADSLAQALANAGDDDTPVGGEDSWADYPPGERNAPPIGFAGLRRTGKDEYELELLSSDDTLTMSGSEAHALGREIDRIASARRVETSAGVFTSVLEKDGRITTTWPATGGKPITVTMSPKEAEKLEQAIQDMVSSIDEFPIDANGDPLLGPDEVVERRTVKAGGTELLLSSHGQYEEGGYVQVESSSHDWYVRLSGADADKLTGGDGEGISSAISGATPLHKRSAAASRVLRPRRRPSGSRYGAVAVTGDVWLRDRANAVLAGLPDLPQLGS